MKMKRIQMNLEMKICWTICIQEEEAEQYTGLVGVACTSVVLIDPTITIEFSVYPEKM